MNLISELLDSLNSKTPNFRPTEIYSESWLIKLVLHHAASLPADNFPLSFQPGSTWYSEGLLPTAFKARYRGDPLSETRTNADGAIGQIQIGVVGKADLSLKTAASQFTVLEAKIHSPLSKSITHAPNYDQAARNVACMAETLAQSRVSPAVLKRLDFIVLAPRKDIAAGKYAREMDLDSIQNKVKERVETYGGEKDAWYTDHFLPAFQQIRIECLAWEDTIQWIGGSNPKVAHQLELFYKFCLKYN